MLSNRDAPENVSAPFRSAAIAAHSTVSCTRTTSSGSRWTIDNDNDDCDDGGRWILAKARRRSMRISVAATRAVRDTFISVGSASIYIRQSIVSNIYCVRRRRLHNKQTKVMRL